MDSPRSFAALLLLVLSFTPLCGQPDSLFRNAKHDTDRLAILFRLAETAPEGEWQQHNANLQRLAEKLIEADPPLSLKKHYRRYLAGAFNNNGYIQLQNGDAKKALSWFHQSLEVYESIGYRPGIAASCINIGGALQELRDTRTSQEYYYRALRISEEIKDSARVANLLLNLGNSYQEQGDLTNALNYLQRALALSVRIHDETGIAADCYNNIGSLFVAQNKIDEGLRCYEKCLQLKTERGDRRGVAGCYINVGHACYDKGEKDKALGFFTKALSVMEELQDRKGISVALYSAGNIYHEKGDEKKALEYAKRSLKLGQEIGYPESIYLPARLLSDIYKKKGKGMEALEMYELYIQMRDSLDSREARRVSMEKKLEYEYEKKEADVRAHASAEKEKLELKAAEDKRKKDLVIYGVIAGLLVVSAFAVVILRNLQLKQKANRIITAQKMEVEAQKLRVELKQQEVLDSIRYARNIQRVLMSSEKYIEKNLHRLRKNAG